MLNCTKLFVFFYCGISIGRTLLRNFLNPGSDQNARIQIWIRYSVWSDCVIPNITFQTWIRIKIHDWPFTVHFYSYEKMYIIYVHLGLLYFFLFFIAWNLQTISHKSFKSAGLYSRAGFMDLAVHTVVFILFPFIYPVNFYCIFKKFWLTL